MKRSFFITLALSALLCLSLVAAPIALAAPLSANPNAAVHVLTAKKKVTAAKKAEKKKAAAIKKATKKVKSTKSAWSRANRALSKAQAKLNKAQASYEQANAAQSANVKKTYKTYKKALKAYNKAVTAEKKAKAKYDAAVSALQKLTGVAPAAPAPDAASAPEAPPAPTDPTTNTADYATGSVEGEQNAPAPDVAPAAGSVDAAAIVGMTQDQLVAQYGQPNRTEPSEYGFTWFVYNSDYSRFLMAGVRGGAVVAVYTNAKGLHYGTALTLGTPIAAVRAALGKPVTSLRDGNTVAMLPHTNEQDLFVVGDKDVTVFYDMVEGGIVTSVMVLPAADETAYVVSGQPMNKELGAAYQRISVDLTNAIRVRHGLWALNVTDANTALALSRSTDMRDRNYFDHITPDNLSPADQAQSMGISYLSLGENIAYGHRDAIFASERFMNSPGHRANMLKDYANIGIGVAVGGNMRVIITCIFTK